MKTKMNLNGTTRRALVAAIGEITSEKPIYRNMPTSNYDIGEITVTKDGITETALDNLHKLVDAKRPA